MMSVAMTLRYAHLSPDVIRLPVDRSGPGRDDPPAKPRMKARNDLDREESRMRRDAVQLLGGGGEARGTSVAPNTRE
jgi:hypothetical protein